MFFVILPAILSSLIGIMLKSMAIEKFDSKSYTLLFAILGSIAFVFIALIQGNIVFSTNLFGWLSLCLTGVLYSLANAQTYTAYKRADFSLCSILFMSNIIICVVLSVLIFKDQMSMYKIMGIIVILVGSVTVLFEGFKKLTFSKGVVNILNAAALSGIVIIVNKFALAHFSSSVVGIANFLFQIPFVATKKTSVEMVSITRRFFPKVLIWFLIAPLSWSMYVYALKNEEISIVQPVYQSTLLIFQVVLGTLILKESKNVPRKIIGLILNVIGIILVNM